MPLLRGVVGTGGDAGEGGADAEGGGEGVVGVEGVELPENLLRVLGGTPAAAGAVELLGRVSQRLVEYGQHHLFSQYVEGKGVDWNGALNGGRDGVYIAESGAATPQFSYLLTWIKIIGEGEWI